MEQFPDLCLPRRGFGKSELSGMPLKITYSASQAHTFETRE